MRGRWAGGGAGPRTPPCACCSPVAAAANGGRGIGEGAAPSRQKGGIHSCLKYSEKTAYVPKFLEKSGQRGRRIQRPQGRGQSRPTVHQAAVRRDRDKRAAGGWEGQPLRPVPEGGREAPPRLHALPLLQPPLGSRGCRVLSVSGPVPSRGLAQHSHPWAPASRTCCTPTSVYLAPGSWRGPQADSACPP